MVRLQDVAEMAKVSVSTASRVLNTGNQVTRISPACIQRVRDAASHLGYVPNYHAQSMQTRLSRTLGVALDSDEGVDLVGNHYFSKILSGMQAAASKAGFCLSLIGNEGERDASETGVEQLRQQRLDGLAVFGVLQRRREDALRHSGEFPLVVIEPGGATDLASVDVDMAAGAALAVRHLADLGHRRLLWMGPRNGRQQVFAAAAWELGLQGAVCNCPGNISFAGPDSIEAVAKVFGDYLDSPHEPFSAVVAWNDLGAIAAYRALLAAGYRIPEDVSVIGFDDVYAALMVPPLTSVSHRFFDMGSTAVDLLLGMIPRSPEEPPLPRESLRLEPTLSVRESTAAPADDTPKGRKA